MDTARLPSNIVLTKENRLQSYIRPVGGAALLASMEFADGALSSGPCVKYCN